ncbi:peptidylprolyl isomerase [Clostridium magnum]|nr:peptidylprolyl isomerase [Clostridium magnum]
MEDGGVIKAELYPDVAPKTVDNFVSLVQSGFYNGLIFHRVIPNFMIQGGDPKGNGTGGSNDNIPGEFKSNGFNNDLKHTRGVLSMARSQDPNSASSQFFIMVKDTAQLDGDYAAFGKVTQGIEEVDKIVNVKRDQNDKPLEPQKMKKVTIEIQ